MKLVDNAKSWYKMFSVQAQIAAGSILGSWSLIPEDLKQNLPQNVVIGVAITLLVFGVVGRLIKQDSINDSTKQ
jgi:hypothetical protein